LSIPKRVHKTTRLALENCEHSLHVADLLSGGNTVKAMVFSDQSFNGTLYKSSRPCCKL